MDQAVGQARNACGSAKDQAREGASAVGAELDSFMSERPAIALLAAVGVGCVLARLMHR